MRVFWIVVTVLVLGAALAVGYPMLAGSKPAPTVSGEVPPSAAVAVAPANQATAAPSVAQPQPVAPAPTAEQSSVPAPQRGPNEASTPAATTPADPGSDALAATLDEVLAGASPAAKPEAEKATSKDTPAAAVVKELPKLEPRPDGSQKVDDRFVIKGKGTKDEPYVVSWEHLISIQETFDPSLKKDKIPGRIQFLDGAYVKLTGFVAFPLAVPQPKELLAMLNQWDGCCIGVPPTAYDAVEVHLRSKVTEEQRFAVHGSVKGKLQIKPYVTGNWLVGLYLMTEAEFDPTQGGTDN